MNKFYFLGGRMIIEELHQHIADKNLKYWLQSFGCQMNAHDSEKIESMLEQIGYIKAQKEADANIIIYNTCCVRENAELKIYGKLGYLKTLKKKNPSLIIGLCGCMMQQDIVLNTLKEKYKFVDMIFGTYNLYKFPEILKTRLETGDPVIDIWDTHKEIDENLSSLRKYHFKACVNVTYGCNNFCTYCIVPYVRGRERSKNSEAIINEVTNLVSEGTKEIMLLGQNVNSYGKTLDPPVSFAELLEKVSTIEGLKRIRFMTSHPKDLSDELIDVMSRNKNICKSLHLPIQSGSDKILKAMNRIYTQENYLNLVKKIKSIIPDITLTTDIIVGFPGETEEDFEETLKVVKEVKYLSAFTFIYSKRTGTPASVMENQVPEEIVKKRFNKLVNVLNEISLDYMKSQVGTSVQVLFEEKSKSNAETITGRTDTGILVHAPASEDLIGNFAYVKITNAKTHYLSGEIIKEELQ
ncbi:tRNA (N6-isopentenyl adenosine(37)-C2)-methylthiotransferase MiaB [Candidatus Epulonipiscium fishelsonii]|uniref:tRNA (N6-isopentenyl adenosine(37)-C2)-methylthiotransferase MiaB n=1 Tax=Candidatus Epulonipiscium fishelsonii TaxID=77094 RepID=A0ACC8XB76_9FIRM|nr:tRNA (N6-isopentenyl adenosine(37)-C2)-methylthiotransferase MiaB [Epulopiscium sp. SCG-B11WGA-EpuloA1]